MPLSDRHTRKSLLSRERETRSSGNRIAGKELGCRESFASGLLQFRQTQPIFSAGHHDTASVNRYDLSGRAADGDAVGLPDLDCATIKIGNGAGKRIESPDLSCQLCGRKSPVKGGF